MGMQLQTDTSININQYQNNTIRRQISSFAGTHGMCASETRYLPADCVVLILIIHGYIELFGVRHGAALQKWP